MNKEFESIEPPCEIAWTEPWREMLYKKALATGKVLPKVPRIIPMRKINNTKNNNAKKT